MIVATTTATRTARLPRWALAFLAAVLARVLAAAVGLFTAGPASALTASAAQTRVGASAPAAGVVVGPSANISAGQRLGNSSVRHRIVAATGVAAEGDIALLRGMRGAADGSPELGASAKTLGVVAHDVGDVGRVVREG